MDRADFISLLGLGTGVVLAGCLGSCHSTADDNNGPAALPVDFTLDLADPANAPLATAGNYVFRHGVLIASTGPGAFLAVAQFCTHAGTQLAYDHANRRVFCSNHGAVFSPTGAVLQPATEGIATPLRAYTTTINGSLLRVRG